jgi:hypothetical protein
MKQHLHLIDSIAAPEQQLRKLRQERVHLGQQELEAVLPGHRADALPAMPQFLQQQVPK